MGCMPRVLSEPTARMLPNKIPSADGKFVLSMPQPIEGADESSHIGMWIPAVLTCAMMHAEISSWQFGSALIAPFFQAGQSPIPPENVYDVPYWSCFVSESPGASAHL